MQQLVVLSFLRTASGYKAKADDDLCRARSNGLHKFLALSRLLLRMQVKARCCCYNDAFRVQSGSILLSSLQVPHRDPASPPPSAVNTGWKERNRNNVKIREQLAYQDQTESATGLLRGQVVDVDDNHHTGAIQHAVKT